MKHIILTLTLMFCAIPSSAQELKVKSFTHDEMDLEARLDGGRTDLNGKQCALVKVLVRDNIVKCKGGNVGSIIADGVVKKIFVSPSARFLEFEFQYSFPLKVTFADYGYSKLTEGSTYCITLVDASVLSQQQLQELMQEMRLRDVETVDSVSFENDIVDVELVDSTIIDSVSVDEECIIPMKTLADKHYTSSIILPITVNGVAFNMIRVDGGTFMMGATSEQENPDSDEKPVHEVTLTTYHIGETEVTQALWKAVMGNNPSYFKGDNYPMEQVSWNDCQKFINKLNRLTNKKFRLPTEAEWEYAARGGNKSKGTQYSGSSDINEVAWYDVNSGGKTHPVKTKKPNELGLYDMSGNVWEWCLDCYDSYSSNHQTNSSESYSRGNKVTRGGGWSLNAKYCRSSNRIVDNPDDRFNGLGLRLVLEF